MSKPAIPPAPSIPASEEQRQQARNNCAERAREKGYDLLASSFEEGGQDDGFAMRFELMRVTA